MKIQFRQSGGVAGLLKGADVDTEKLPPEEARQLAPLLEWLAQPRPGGPPVATSQMADAEQMTVIVQDGPHSGPAIFSRKRVPPGLQPALDYLAGKSNYLKRQG